MELRGKAVGSPVENLVKMLRDAEVNGGNKYYELYFWAKKLGYDDVAEAIYLNAGEDAAHGGKYSVMLGNGPKDEADFWKQVVAFYKAEAGAEEKITEIVATLNNMGEKEIANEVALTAPEENMHAERLEKVFLKHGIKYK